MIELMIASSIALVCLLSVGTIISESQKAWNYTYNKATSSNMLDSHVASKTFEATIRKASSEKYLLDSAGRWVAVFYFDSDTSAETDRYAKFYVENAVFYLEYGVISPSQIIDTVPICGNVAEYNFSGSGRCIRLDMTLGDPNTGSDVSFVTSAVPQNQ